MDKMVVPFNYVGKHKMRRPSRDVNSPSCQINGEIHCDCQLHMDAIIVIFVLDMAKLLLNLLSTTLILTEHSIMLGF